MADTMRGKVDELATTNILGDAPLTDLDTQQIVLPANGKPLNIYRVERTDKHDRLYKVYISFIVFAEDEVQARQYAQWGTGKSDGHYNMGILYAQNTFLNPETSNCTLLDPNLIGAGIVSSEYKGE